MGWSTAQNKDTTDSKIAASMITSITKVWVCSQDQVKVERTRAESSRDKLYVLKENRIVSFPETVARPGGKLLEIGIQLTPRKRFLAVPGPKKTQAASATCKSQDETMVAWCICGKGGIGFCPSRY